MNVLFSVTCNQRIRTKTQLKEDTDDLLGLWIYFYNLKYESENGFAQFDMTLEQERQVQTK